MFHGPNFLFELKDHLGYDNLHIESTYHPSPHVVSHFKNVTGKLIVLLYPGEYHRASWLDEVFANVKAHHQATGQINKYFAILSHHTYPESILKEYGEYFTVIVDPTIYYYYTNYIPKTELDFSTPVDYHFLSLNNRASVIRQSLFYFFNKFSLLDKSRFSYLGDLNRSKYNSIKEITEIIQAPNVPWYNKNLDLSELDKLIPFKIAGDTFVVNDSIDKELYMYKDTFCSIVTETYDDEQYAFISEKTFKPLAFGRPFLLYSNNGTIQLLKDMGFKTFDRWWDESYDTLSQNQRFESILHIILEIAGWSIEKLEQVRQEMLPTLEHNYNHFFNTLPEIYKQQRPVWFEQIKQIVDQKKHLL